MIHLFIFQWKVTRSQHKPMDELKKKAPNAAICKDVTRMSLEERSNFYNEIDYNGNHAFLKISCNKLKQQI